MFAGDIVSFQGSFSWSAGRMLFPPHSYVIILDTKLESGTSRGAAGLKFSPARRNFISNFCRPTFRSVLFPDVNVHEWGRNKNKSPKSARDT